MNQDEQTPQKDLNFLTPALIGGVTLAVISSGMGVLSSFGLGLLQLACCLWQLGCPALATFQLNKQRPGGLTYGDGALVGVFSGVFATIISTILGIPLRYMMTAQLEQASEQIRNAAQMPPAFRDFFLQFMAPGFNPMVLLIGLVLGLIINSIFGSIGGSLTVAILNRKKND